MEERFARTALLLGAEAMARLAQARVAVFGLGGVGGYVVEALARSGVGALDLVDHDTISLSNLNRQILATERTLGQYKTAAAAARVAEINPAACVRCHRVFYLPETAGQFDLSQYDYIVDAVDTVTAKLLLAEGARHAGVPLISVMGTGNKLDPTSLRVADITETRGCPLARIMRKELKKRGIDHLRVVYSPELPLAPRTDGERLLPEHGHSRRPIPGSTAFVPAAAGLIAAGEVVRALAQP